MWAEMVKGRATSTMPQQRVENEGKGQESMG